MSSVKELKKTFVTGKIEPASPSPVGSAVAVDARASASSSDSVSYLDNWEAKCKSLLEEFHASERVSEFDLAIQINTKA